ncbi:murein L,D-transpeptidase family protein [uncultured Hyphomicrobium sp.]|uniref:L,D-transpeptidase family protein n=1 Tax=uncultured Hyphomicrobium sp. TaxID=194373 RepID=UPI0025DF4C1B|nr:murein L,D-transpeptidase family protein [uncultured Hyphomicrobium sp.]
MSGVFPGRRTGRLAAGAGFVMAALLSTVQTAAAITIELKDVAADRIERQRAFVEGRLPLADTPEIGRLEKRLAEAGLKSGAPMLMRIFKETSELELWLEKGDRFVLFATYPICHWSGTLGPKLREGDKQTPEGFYTITNRQMRHFGRWTRAINLGFPNAYDRAHDRDGSYILMHGGCSSVGCFAMTNQVIGEIYGLANAAIKGGQRHVPVHVFPFRLTDEALAARASSPWHGFWSTLQAGSKSFERTGRPPRVSVCDGQYRVDDAAPKAVAAAEEDVPDKKRRGKSRSDMMLGAVRSGCPAPVVVTAEGKGQAGTETPGRTR